MSLDSRLRVLFLFLPLLLGLPGASQECEPKLDPKYEFYSGVVADPPGDRVTVVRQVTGKPMERRTFLITSETKIEGRLRQRARVTVGYTTTDEGDVAMRIIVRSSPPAPNPAPKN